MGIIVADSYWVDTVVLLLTAGYLLYWYLTSTFDFWKKQGVKEIKVKEPYFGAMRKALTLQKQFAMHFSDMYWELDSEKYGGLFQMRVPSLIVRDPELLKIIMVKDFAHFTDTITVVSEKNDPMFGKLL
jgi:hypothetical protein